MMRSIDELLSMTGRVAIVTGGAGHIGYACCEALVQCGASTVIVDRDKDNSLMSADRLRTLAPGAPVITMCADVTNEEDVSRLVTSTLQTLGRIDVLVHCAALTGESALHGYSVPFEMQTLSAWQAAMSTNLTSAFLLARHARAALEQSRNGSIVNVSSIYGIVGPDLSLYEGTHMGNPAAYAATKGGLVQLTKYLATVLAPGIRVNAVSPGGIERAQPEVFRKRYQAKTPLGRLGKEEDLKGAVAFLASDASAYVTGHNLVIDGGWTAW